MAAQFTEENVQELKFRLEDATIKCSERCLYQSAKWAAEMLDAIVPIDQYDTDPESPMDIPDTPSTRPNPYLRTQDPVEASLEAQESYKYLLAKSYFDTREYDRCAAVFLPPTIPPVALSTSSPNQKKRQSLTPQKGKSKSSLYAGGKDSNVSRNPYPRLSQKSLFLALYSKYLAGEKRKDEETEMVLGPADGGATVNRELPDLARGLEGWLTERREKGMEDRNQGWLEYLYGVILLKGRNEEEAKKWLIRSVHLNPFHWGAWQELNDLLSSTEDLKQVVDLLPQNIMTLLFHVYCSQELYQATEDTYQALSELETIFPNSAFLMTQRALLYYHSKDFEEASRIFTEILIASPHRLDSLDHYSNILYVMGARPQLAFVAQVATATDKFRPETCCVVGNYYSLKSEHEKAVMYFRRALTLDRNFLSAWTLMGHEYIEMKNTHARLNPTAAPWTSTAKTTEPGTVSARPALRPYDPKMWQAVGSCYAKMGRVPQSIKALKRALVAGSYYAEDPSQLGGSGRKILDPETLHQIATLYERLGDDEEAAAYMELTLQQESGQMPVEEDASSDNENDDDQSEVGAQKSSRRARQSSTYNQNDDDDDSWHGTGPTVTTSKARLWLARWALRNGDLERADQLAAELCQDGVEVEEAKALMRDVRARREGDE
ncbi:cell division cycle [Aspergillus arachidicola]|uniref:Cell division cycle n=1 Tax=Aspergillus arachidicola TaxID=656916 RepID=A0A2G7ELJ1_9EURO|nr:cell division cycle [Aspergillus arachidicola]